MVLKPKTPKILGIIIVKKCKVHKVTRCVSAFEDLLGCLGSMATRTMGVASKLSGVKGEQAGEVDRVADFKTHSSRPPIPDRRGQGKDINR